MIIIGIDVGTSPGAPGAIAVLEDGKATDIHDMPVLTETVKVNKNESGVGTRSSLDLTGFYKLMKQYPTEGTLVGLEAQTIYGHDGRRSGGVLMRTYGRIEGVLLTLGLAYMEIPPKVWQKVHTLTGDKDSHLIRARELYPKHEDRLKLKKNHGRADALLIANYLHQWGEQS